MLHTFSDSIPLACVMGKPIQHSLSPLIHNYWLKTLNIPGEYRLQELESDQFASFVQQMPNYSYVGGNVTLPHKEAAFALSEQHDPNATAVGAVNTLWFEQGKLIGGNSDVMGFMGHLNDTVPTWRNSVTLATILGAGGAAKAVSYALLQEGIQVQIVNRHPDRASQLIHGMYARCPELATPNKIIAGNWEQLPKYLKRTDLLVNCTSAGMRGHVELPLEISPLKPSAIVYDIVYTPRKTGLLLSAEKQGNQIIDGLGMLLHQATYGFEKWFIKKPFINKELRDIINVELDKREIGNSGNSDTKI